ANGRNSGATVTPPLRGSRHPLMQPRRLSFLLFHATNEIISACDHLLIQASEGAFRFLSSPSFRECLLALTTQDATGHLSLGVALRNAEECRSFGHGAISCTNFVPLQKLHKLN